MDALTLTTETRVKGDTGKGPARRLRARGLVPGVFYGPGAEPRKLPEEEEAPAAGAAAAAPGAEGAAPAAAGGAAPAAAPAAGGKAPAKG